MPPPQRAVPAEKADGKKKEAAPKAPPPRRGQREADGDRKE
jgi:hypothetical protein